VRKSVVFARTASAEERRILAEKLGWPEEERVLAFSLAVSAQGSARPVEVIEAFFGEGAAEVCEIVRTGLGPVGVSCKSDSLRV
jgi:hypothetical protein